MLEAALQDDNVVFLMKHLSALGCPFTKKHFTYQPCNSDQAGGFSPEYGIVLCDVVKTKEQAIQVLRHELIHAIDYCRAKLDFKNPLHLACSEIRASNLSGDCDWKTEIKRGHFPSARQHLNCVRRRALLSSKSKEHIDQVWDICIQDLWPYDKIK